MEQDVIFHDRFGHRVAGILSAPSNSTDRLAVLCHGFLSGKNSTTNKILTRMLGEQGIATLRFDFFGHGESEGPFEQISTTIGVAQAIAALDEAAVRGFQRLGLIGSSFGGLVSILATARWSDRLGSPQRIAAAGPVLSCLALKCPVVDFSEELRLEFGEEGMQRWKATNTIPNILGDPQPIRLDYAFYEDSMNLIAYDPALTIHVPTLIVQGDCDELVPLHQSRRLFHALSGPKRLELLPGADHRFSRGEDFRKMTSLLTDWLTDHLARG
ncbi:MAG: alpha/beta fold hydrolase [Nitrospiraceae bacterium]